MDGAPLSDLVNDTDLVEYISQYTDFEEKHGEYWALSPLKDEKTPSFSIGTDRRHFYDFSSGQGGNIIDFIMAYNHCGFSKAADTLRKYAEKDGHWVPKSHMEVTLVAKKFARKPKKMRESKAKVLPDDYMDRYERDLDKLALWRDEGISQETLDRFGVRYDSFSNRIVYPIWNMDGKIINVSGRICDPLFKEKKMPKYIYLKPLGILNLVYLCPENRSAIQEAKNIIFFEGAKSVMLMDTWGMKNAGAILTSHLNPIQVKILIKMGKDVVFALDKDVNIKEDANIRTLKRFIRVEYVIDKDNLLSDKMSPVDAGVEVWNHLYQHRMFYR